MSRRLSCSAVVLAMSLAAVAQDAAAQSPRSADPKYRGASRPVPGQYIVKLTDETSAPAPLAALATRHRGQIMKIYRSINAFAVQMTAADARALAAEPSVRYVEEDAYVFLAETQTQAPWGLDRVDQRALPLNGTYEHRFTGAGVNAYVMDTGIRLTHLEFRGRIVSAFDNVNDGQNGNDCNGHGTHVAGTIGGATYGVAKTVKLHSVRVYSCDGVTTWSALIEAADWVTWNHVKPAVVNMSFGGVSYSPAFTDAVQRIVAAGATVVVAAGNASRDACNTTPAGTPEAITVAAVDRVDFRGEFSNFGACVDLFAPGVDVESAYYASDTSTTLMTGTSMASPHVAGAAALFLEANPFASPEAVANALVANATAEAVFNPGAGSPNLLLYTAAVAPGSDQTPPTVTITAPVANTPVRGRLTLSAHATDNVGVSKVLFFVDDILVGADATAPYAVSWDSDMAGHGVHRLVARVFDSSGNQAGSAPRTITVDLVPPVTMITSPMPGATITGGVTVAASAADAGGINKVVFFDGAAEIATDTTAPYSFTWDTSRVPSGIHQLATRAHDIAGNVGASASVSVTVQNAAIPTELIVSGGFEPTVMGWQKSGAAYFSTGGVERTGIGYAYLAKADSVVGAVSQQVTIPAGTTPSFSFWLNVTSAETSSVAADKLFVEVLDAGGMLQQTLAVYSNLDKADSGAYVMKGGFSLGAYAGQAIRIQFRAATDAVNVTAFRIDDVSLDATAPPPAELIVSGGFEPTVTGWQKTGAAYFSTGGVERTGVGYAYLAKANSVVGAVSQQVTIPAGTTPSFSFWLNVTSAETSSVAADKLFVEVLDAGGVLRQTLAVYSNLDRAAAGAYVMKGGFSLGAYAGQTIRIQFRAATDAVNVTAFRIDDVSVDATAPPPAELIVSGGFEPTVTGWQKNGAAYFSTGGVERTGVGYAYLAKANSVEGTVSQQITIPVASKPALSFWLNVTSTEPSTTVPSDTLFVEVLTSSGTLLETLATYSNLDDAPAGAYVLSGGLSLGRYSGQTIRLQFRVTTDAVNITTFRIDDVSVR
jgi:subtilisin family serine protease